MNRTSRRIVTGVDVDGKSSVVDDSRIGEGELGNFNLWMTEPGRGDRGERLPFFRVDTGRHPLMHVTPTTDYIMLLEGEVSSLLDNGDPVPLRPFDAVVQRGTNHVWLVTGSGPAVFLAVMAGSH